MSGSMPGTGSRRSSRRMDTGDTAWMLMSTALVMVMLPGLALFYGGLVRRKNVLSTIMHSFFGLALVSIVWVLIGFSLAFAPDAKIFGVTGLIGGLDFAGFMNVGLTVNPTYGAAAAVPFVLFASFQLMFAAITPALITGAFAERKRFASFVVFTILWSILVYSPIAHWVWASDGWLFGLGALDFAGGTVVHASSGVSALIVALLIGRRVINGGDHMEPHDIPMTVLGTGILWFGWFGFNAGSALAANGQAIQAFTNTFLAAAAAGLAWAVVERIRDGHFTNLGVASGIVAGLVAITPGSGFVAGMSPIWIGLAAGVICSFAVHLKFKAGYDDALDVVGVHFVGGLVGSLLIGLFADPEFFAGTFKAGLFYGGDASLLMEQALAAVVTIVFSFVVTFVILKLLDLTIGIR